MDNVAQQITEFGVNFGQTLSGGAVPATAGGVIGVIAILAVANAISRLAVKVATVAIAAAAGYYFYQAGYFNQFLG